MGIFDIFGAKKTQSDVKALLSSFIVGVSDSAGIDILELRTIALVKGFGCITLGEITSTRGKQTGSIKQEFLAVVNCNNLKEFAEFQKLWIEVASSADVEGGAVYKNLYSLVDAVAVEFAKQSPEYRRLKEL